jgi:hypothetical protein
MRPDRLISTNDPSSHYPLEGADHAWVIAMTDSHLARHFSQGIDLMEESGAKHAGRAINRLEIGLAMGSVSARRGSSQIEVGFEA